MGLNDFDPGKKDLVAKKRELESLVKDYKLHLDQYEKCRKSVQKLEKECPVGTAICWRDYVNFYSDGKDIKGGNQVATSHCPYNRDCASESINVYMLLVPGKEFGACGALEGERWRETSTSRHS